MKCNRSTVTRTSFEYKLELGEKEKASGYQRAHFSPAEVTEGEEKSAAAAGKGWGHLPTQTRT